MVSGINASSVNAANNTSNLNKEDAQKLLKYVSGQALKEKPDTFESNFKSSAASVGFFEGIPLLKFLSRSKKLNQAGSTFVKDEMTNLSKKNAELFKNIFKKGEGGIGEKISKFVSSSNKSRHIYSDLKSFAKQESKVIKASDKYAKIAEKLASNPENGRLAKAAEKALNKSTKAAEEAIAKKATITATETAAKSGGKVLGKAGKFLKSSGAGIMLAISGIIEMATEVVPTFKELGAEKGLKQLGKSTIKVALDTAGFIGGEAAGTAIGTAIGSAIFPGVGSAIGAGVGFLCGMLGSFVAGKVSKAVVGKSEREKVKEQQEQQQAQDIANNKEALDEVKQQAMAILQEDAADGELSEDSKEIAQILEQIENENNSDTSNPFAA